MSFSSGWVQSTIWYRELLWFHKSFDFANYPNVVAYLVCELLLFCKLLGSANFMVSQNVWVLRTAWFSELLVSRNSLFRNLSPGLVSLPTWSLEPYGLVKLMPHVINGFAIVWSLEIHGLATVWSSNLMVSQNSGFHDLSSRLLSPPVLRALRFPKVQYKP